MAQTQFGPGLGAWFDRATCGLSRASAAQVREEIQAHYEQAYEDAMAGGSNPDEAARIALETLGDATDANRAYKKILVTRWEARLMGEDEWVGRAVCKRRGVMVWLAVGFLCAGAGSFVLYPSARTAVLLFCVTGIAALFLVPMYLPIYSRERGRLFRALKWAWVVVLFGLAYGPTAYESSWREFLVTANPMLWIFAYIEWTRARLRRKLPIDQWPRSLYL